jgi:hypothetical protein
MWEQEKWTEHADYMNTLEADHSIILGGPLGNYPKHRAMLVFDAPDEQAVRAKLASDIWIRSEMLRTISFYTWEIVLGRLQ